MSFFRQLSSLRQSPSVSSFLVVVLLLGVYWLGPISTWETNDDVMYKLLLSGKVVASTPEPYVVLIQYPLAVSIAGLYKLLPEVPWYPVFHVAAIVLSVFFLNFTYALARGNDKFWMRLLVSLVCALPFLFYLQFTKTALVMGVSGYLALVLLNQGVVISPRRSLIFASIAVVLLTLSFSLRKESFFLATLICAVPVGFSLRQRKKALLVALGAATLLIGVSAGVHRHQYGDGWEDFSVLGELSGPILHYGQYAYDTNKDVYDTVGWSYNDYLFFRSWGYIDSNVYSRERIEQIVSRARVSVKPRNPVLALKGAAEFPAMNYLFALALLSAGILLFYRRSSRLLCIGSLVIVALCAAFLAWEGRFPARVSTSLAYAIPWLLLVESGVRRSGFLWAVPASILLLLLAYPVYGQSRDLSELARYRQAQNGELRRLGEATAPSPVILAVLGASFPFEGMLPFASVNYLGSVDIVWLCGFNQSPVQKKQLVDNGIKDIFEALLTRRNTYIALSPMETGLLQRYLSEHYGRSVNMRPVFAVSSFRIYQAGATN